MPFISVVSGCFNESSNVRELYERVTRVFREELPDYRFEFILIDNASTDNTFALLQEIAGTDKRVKLIRNNRNFGHIRSCYHALLQASGQAVVVMASDLQDPAELIPKFVAQWEAGHKVVMAQKTSSEESRFVFLARKAYYGVLNRLSEVPLKENVTGFGLYDRAVVENIRRLADPYPYFRGLISELGYEPFLILFRQPKRKGGVTHSTLYVLYDMAMLGLTNHSKVPLRLAVISGFFLGLLSFLVAFGYLVYKLLFWNNFQVGTAPIVIGLFFLGSVQLIFTGILGEYLGALHTQVLRRPPVVEKERINFDNTQPRVTFQEAASSIPEPAITSDSLEKLQASVRES